MKLEKIALLASIATVAALFAGCPPPPMHVAARHVPANLAGIYNGHHDIAFNITAPVPRPMPPDRRPGPIHVTDEVSGVQLSLRLYENGEPCHLRGVKQAGTGRVVINPGQRCSLRMLYQGTLVIAGVQINQGVADFTGHNLQTNLTGPFVAEALVSGGRQSMSGNARLTFTGTRMPSR